MEKLKMGRRKIDQYMKERYEDQVRWYDEKAIYCKRMNYLCQIPIIIMGPLITVFALLEYKWITVLLSAIMSILIGILNFCKFEEKWHNYRTTCETLKKEKYFYEYRLNEYRDAEDPEELFINRVESIISREHTKWLRIEKEKRKQTNN